MKLLRHVRQCLRSFFDDAKATRQFIHIPKNGGVAVRDALTLQRDVVLATPYHSRVRDLPQGPRYFSVIRNPWARTASRYQFGKQNAARWPDGDPRKVYMRTATFEQFVREQPILPIPEHPGQPWMGPLSSWFNQLDWLCDAAGKVVCDCLRLEYLDTDLSRYLGRKITVRRRNATHDRYDYRTMYTPALARIVEETFAADIEHFGFTFDGSAMRNYYGARP